MQDSEVFIDVTLDSTSDTEEVDVSFLESDQQDDVFALQNDFYEIVSKLSTKPAFVPSLHDSVFEQPLNHAVWNSQWPEPTRHFPS